MSSPYLSHRSLPVRMVPWPTRAVAAPTHDLFTAARTHGTPRSRRRRHQELGRQGIPRASPETRPSNRGQAPAQLAPTPQPRSRQGPQPRRTRHGHPQVLAAPAEAPPRHRRVTATVRAVAALEHATRSRGKGSMKDVPARPDILRNSLTGRVFRGVWRPLTASPLSRPNVPSRRSPYAKPTECSRAASACSTVRSRGAG